MDYASFPFDERGPLYSLALLYPRYLGNPEVFVCPDAAKSEWKRKLAATFPEETELRGRKCYYGYFWHRSRRANFPVVADMPMNHADRKGKVIGFNVLYDDGHVSWSVTPFCANDPEDNIFAQEPGWSPDTDTYIRQK